MKNTPDYKKFFNDIINIKFPEKKEICSHLLAKSNLTVLDIIDLNELLFRNSSKENSVFNQKHRSYNESVIYQILEYQKKNRLNNSQLAGHFKLSRNTVTKWKNLFPV
ncbi:hypothetical protein HNP24_001047 [Chryseobacterium sediminis]|uniref:Helix-turn-helix domain-containing protein n=1 Tax=Chryseobacterium sediminis TaxID=1679494 RepID=A0ABR6PWK4_9FLAO|nr:helix-turn-helix domain-containing protein [Chryseobacterium sediminis]MBB6330097.1 hypothetical protein [Chryseobacterium sediminis]